MKAYTRHSSVSVSLCFVWPWPTDMVLPRECRNRLYRAVLCAGRYFVSASLSGDLKK